jgi:polar amino acid transport system substrate-binding protein
MRFSQPYFQSSLSILSRVEKLGIWARIAPFFSRSFFTAVGILLCILAVVGALVWLLERRAGNEAFPRDPVRGIANGIWFAVVTMSTVGYGDLAPRTMFGRLISGLLILVSIVVAASLAAGGASMSCTTFDERANA